MCPLPVAGHPGLLATEGAGDALEAGAGTPAPPVSILVVVSSSSSGGQSSAAARRCLWWGSRPRSRHSANRRQVGHLFQNLPSAAINEDEKKEPESILFSGHL